MNSADKRSGRQSSRDKLLDAAADLVANQGINHLTIEAVAAAANITKAGLIYHFKTRDDLLKALVERMANELDIQKRPIEAVSDGEGTLKDVLIRLSHDTFDMPPRQRLLLSNILGAVTANPHLIEPVQNLYERGYEWAVQSGTHAGQAMILAAALDGITLLELLNLHTFTPQQRQVMRDALEQAIHDLP